MTDAVLSISFAGPHVSVQDAGRRGMMRFGVPWSGPMDRRAFAAANIALGNPPDAPAIEVSLGGLVVDCTSGAVSFAVAGGGFIVEHGGQKRGSWCLATLRAGDRLTVRPGPWGSWCYLALAGNLQTARWLGSASTHAVSGLGGGKLAAGMTLTVADAAPHSPAKGDIPCPVGARPRFHLRVTLGPQQRFFGDDAVDALFTGTWRMTAAADRMGVRLAGPSIAPQTALDMPSEPVVRGSVQVAGDGVASVLLADHQTTGGYPKIATVLDCDTDSLAQLRAGDPVAFHRVSAAEAIAIARLTAETDHRHRLAIARPRHPSR